MIALRRGFRCARMAGEGVLMTHERMLDYSGDSDPSLGSQTPGNHPCCREVGFQNADRSQMPTGRKRHKVTLDDSAG